MKRRRRRRRKISKKPGEVRRGEEGMRTKRGGMLLGGFSFTDRRRGRCRVVAPDLIEGQK